VTIRYVRDGLRVVRVQTVAELTALHAQAAAAQRAAYDFKVRAQALKDGLLDDHRRRVAAGLRPGHRPGEPPPPRVSTDTLLRARRKAKLSQRDLAAALGLSRSTVAEAERGRNLPHPYLARWAHDVLHAPAPDDDDEEVSA
jgi:DNA-binding XRE family transcriptional regulator